MREKQSNVHLSSEEWLASEGIVPKRPKAPPGSEGS